MAKDRYLDFEAYQRAKKPHTRQKASAWHTAIGLQRVDGLEVSAYLRQTAARHIEGDEVRPFDITKKEWVLCGDTMLYGRAEDILRALSP